MAKLLEIREHIKNFCGRYEKYVIILVRFFLSIICLFGVVNAFSTGKNIESTPVVLVLSALSAVLSTNVMVIITAIYILAELYFISTELLIVMAVVFILFFTLYLALAPEDGIILVLSGVFASFGLPFLMPACAGLTRRVNSVIPQAFGIITCYMLKVMGGASLKSTADAADISVLQAALNQILASKEMYLMVVLAIVTTCIVYIIRRLSVNHSWQFAIIFGMIFQLLVMIIANFVLSLHMAMGSMFVGFVLSMLVAFILQFFVFQLDYKRTETVQFEDDEYYYYVKAVPKVSVALKSKTVKNISTKKRSVRRDVLVDDELDGDDGDLVD